MSRLVLIQSHSQKLHLKLSELSSLKRLYIPVDLKEEPVFLFH